MQATTGYDPNFPDLKLGTGKAQSQINVGAQNPDNLNQDSEVNRPLVERLGTLRKLGPLRRPYLSLGPVSEETVSYVEDSHRTGI